MSPNKNTNKPTLKPLWDKGSAISDRMQQLTVGSDPVYDGQLFIYDCIGSAAQAKVLHHASIIDTHELTSVLNALREIYSEALKGGITIPYQLEDCHTLLESKLVEKIGDIGKKIHTGRSRNDQIILTTRLFLREQISEILAQLITISDLISLSYEKNSETFLPGYTHLQPAMPSSVGMYLHAFYDWMLECIEEGVHLYSSINKNPLGAAAGFGSSLPLDREFSARVLGFDGIQRSFIDIQNSRGRYEERFLFWLCSIGSLFEKFAWDMELFFTKEFSFISLDDSMTTGSSIMPQKKNPDIVELLRGRSALQRSFVNQIQAVTSKLPSHYHRDLALTKQPLFDGIENMKFILGMSEILIPAISFNEEKLNQSRIDNPDMYATYAAYQKVNKGIPFRDAYAQTAKEVSEHKISHLGYEAEYNAISYEVSFQMKQSKADSIRLQDSIKKIEAKLENVTSEIFSV
jgi:argininosuccinate lyase